MDSRNLFGQEIYARRGETTTTSIGTSELPVGVPVPWPAAVAPTGWLICDGGAIPAGCPTLTALYGANLPNLKGMVIVGRDAAQTEFDTLLETGGQKAAPTSAHTHTADDNDAGGQTHGHTENHQTVNAAHGHGSTTAENRSDIYYDGGAPSNTFTTFSGAARFINTVAFNGLANGHTHPVPSANATHAHNPHANHVISAHNHDITVQPATASGNNLQPYRVFNYIVRAA